MREPTLITRTASNVEAMRELGADIADALADVATPVVIALEGELGAGKTTLVGSVLRRFGYAGHARSPTYTLIEPYEFAGRSVFHLDLYRLADPTEVEPLAVRDLLQPHTIFLIEWPEKASGALPPIDVTIRIRYAGEGRQVELIPGSKLGESVLQHLSATAKS